MKLLISSILLSFSSVASACPVDFADGEAIIHAIHEAQTCADAVSVAEQCAYGSSFDVQTTGVAKEKCEKDFQNITPAQELSYSVLVEACYAKYQNEGGTMYRSFESFCALSVAKTMSGIFKAD